MQNLSRPLSVFTSVAGLTALVVALQPISHEAMAAEGTIEGAAEGMVEGAAEGPPQSDPLPGSQNTLTVEVSGLRNESGQVCLSLFEGGSGFPDGDESVAARQCVAAADVSMDETAAAGERAAEAVDEAEVVDEAEAVDEAQAADEPIRVTFEGLSGGTYAVSVLHDEDEDVGCCRC